MRFLILIVTFASILQAQTPAPNTGAGPAQAPPAGNAENGRSFSRSGDAFNAITPSLKAATARDWLRAQYLFRHS